MLAPTFAGATTTTTWVLSPKRTGPGSPSNGTTAASNPYCTTTWPASAWSRRNDCYENIDIGRRVDGTQMLRLRRHRISQGRAAGPAGTQDLPAALQAVSRQGPSKVGLDDLA